MVKILQGSVVTQTTLGGLTYISGWQISCSVYVPKIMKIGWQWTKLLQKLSGLLFWPTLYSTARTFKAENSQDRIYRTTSIKRRYQINSGLLIEATQSY